MKNKTNKNWFGKRFHRQQHARRCDVNRFGSTVYKDQGFK